MAFTEISRLASTAAAASAGSRTAIFILSSAPAAGQWIAVALYTNRGNIPSTVVSGSNNQVTSVTCGSVALSVIDSPTASGQTSPTLYAAPYQAAMTTTVSVTWSNTVASTTLGFVAMVFSGADTTNTTGYANFRTVASTGAFDGGGSSTFGAGYAAASSGVTTWTNSSDAIQTNYGDQQQPYIAAVVDTNVPTSSTLQVVRACSVFGRLADSSGNVYAAFGTPGTLPINSTSGVYNPAGALAYAVGYGNYGNFVFTYTGISGGSLTGCALLNGDQDYTRAYIDSYGPIMLAGTSAVSMTAILNNSTTSAWIGSFTTGRSSAYANATQGTTLNGHVMVGVGGTGTTPARLHLIGGYASNGRKNQSAYSVGRIGGTTLTNGGGVIYTMVPSTRTITVAGNENSTGSTTGTDASGRVKNGANQPSAAEVGTKFREMPRQGASTLTKALTSTKIAAYLRNASSSLTESVVATKFMEMLKSSAVATAMASAGGKLVGYVMDASNALTQYVAAAKYRVGEVTSAVAQEAVAVANRIYGAVRSGLAAVEQATSSGRLAEYVNTVANAAGQAVTSAKSQVHDSIGAVSTAMRAVGGRSLRITVGASVTLGQAVNSASSRALNAAGTVVAAVAIASYRVVSHTQFGSALIESDAAGVKVGEAIRSAAVSIASVAEGGKRVETSASGAASATSVTRAGKARERLSAGASALSTVGRATRVVLFNRSGVASLSEAVSVASYVYAIAHTINVAYSETLENGLYRERATSLEFTEDAVASYQEGLDNG